MATRSTSPRARWGLAALVVGYAFLDLVAGAPDSPLTPVFPSGVGPPEWSTRAAAWLGLDRLSRTALTVVGVAVLAGLVAAFAVVIVEAWRGRVRLASVMAVGGAALTLAVLAPVLLSRDVYSYAVYGRTFALYGANPYVVAPATFASDPFAAVASPEWINSPSVYGPAFTLLSGGVAKAWAGSAAGTILAFKLIAAGSVAVAAALAASTARVLRPGKEAAAAAAICLNPVVVVHTVGGGHNDALLAACLLAGLALAAGPEGQASSGRTRARPVAPAFLGVTAMLTLAVLIKSVAVPLLVLWLWRVVRRAPQDRRAASLAPHLGVVVGLAVATFAPLVAGGQTFRALISVVSRQGWASGPSVVARVARAVGRAVGGPSGGPALGTLTLVLFAGVFLVVFWRILERPGDVVGADSWGRSMLLLALAGPYLLPWYAAWFVPLAVFLEDAALIVVALAAAGLLALTGVPAEPGSTPHVWEAMMLGVHYGAAPLMLGLLGVAVGRTLVGTGHPGGPSPPRPSTGG